MNRQEQIDLMRGAEERVRGYLRRWSADPQFKAALHRDSRRASAPWIDEEGER